MHDKDYDKELIRSIPHLNISLLNVAQLEPEIEKLLAPVLDDEKVWGRFRLEYAPATWAICGGRGLIVSQWIKRKLKDEVVIYRIKDVRHQHGGLTIRQWKKAAKAVYDYIHPKPPTEQGTLFNET